MKWGSAEKYTTNWFIYGRKRKTTHSEGDIRALKANEG